MHQNIDFCYCIQIIVFFLYTIPSFWRSIKLSHDTDCILFSVEVSWQLAVCGSMISHSYLMGFFFFLCFKDVQIGQRMITISSVGVPNTIKKLASYKLQSTLAIRCVILYQKWRMLGWMFMWTTKMMLIVFV